VGCYHSKREAQQWRLLCACWCEDHTKGEAGEGRGDRKGVVGVDEGSTGEVGLMGFSGSLPRLVKMPRHVSSPHFLRIRGYCDGQASGHILLQALSPIQYHTNQLKMSAEADVKLEDFSSIFSLPQKVAVVTGGSRGLGLHAASG